MSEPRFERIDYTIKLSREYTSPAVIDHETGLVARFIDSDGADKALFNLTQKIRQPSFYNWRPAKDEVTR